jgi:hypothetical protein
MKTAMAAVPAGALVIGPNEVAVPVPVKVSIMCGTEVT